MGRIHNASRYETVTRPCLDEAAAEMKRFFANLMRLADGGIKQVVEKYEPAGIVTYNTREGPKRAFPHLPKDEIILVQRNISWSLPDRGANMYLINRVIGRPAREIPDSDADFPAVRDVVAEMEAAARSYEHANGNGNGDRPG